MADVITGLLRLKGDAASAKAALQQTRNDMQKMSRDVRGLTSALSGIAAAFGVSKLASGLKQIATGAIEATAEIQQLRISLDGIAAQELVERGQFDTLTDALGSAGELSGQLYEEWRRLAIASPFEAQVVAKAMRFNAVMGASADMLADFTQSMLDAAAFSGLTNEEFKRMSYNLAQAVLKGDLTAANLRQLKGVTLDLAKVFRSELGMSIEEVREGLKSGAITARETSEAFMRYAEKNYAGAAERMAKSWQGLKSSIKDFGLLAAADVLGPLLDKVTAALAALFDKATALLESGFFKKIGEFLATPLGMAVVGGIIALVGGFLALGAALSGLLILIPAIGALATAIGGLVGFLAPVLLPLIAIIAALGAALLGLIAGVALLYVAWVNNWGGIRDAVMGAWEEIAPKVQELAGLIMGWVQNIAVQLKFLAGQIWGIVEGVLAPAFEYIATAIRSVDWAGTFSMIADYVNIFFRNISRVIEAISNLIEGRPEAALAVMKEGFIDTLTWIAMLFDDAVRAAVVWGANLVTGIAQGMWSAAQGILVAVLNAIGNLIGGFLKSGSPPKVGPLAGIVKWGRGLMNTYLRAFALADFGLLKDALSPIKQALEAAVSAGTLEEANYLQVFKDVRTEVGGLLAMFRETGEISEKILGNIAAKLGEGSEEYVKMLRLQLEYRKASDKVADIEKEIAAAREKGFVSKALKDRLAAAKAEEAAAKDAYDWQQAYLDAQHESIDLQMRLIDALQELTGALGGAGGGAGGLGGLGGAMGGLPAAWDFGDLPEFDMDFGIDPVELGKMSEEFDRMRSKIEALLDPTVSFRTKLMMIALWLDDVTGQDFSGWLGDVFDVIDTIDEQGLAKVVRDWVENGLAVLVEDETLPQVTADIIMALFDSAVLLLLGDLAGAAVIKQALGMWFFAVFVQFIIDQIAKADEYGELFKSIILTGWLAFLGFILAKVGELSDSLKLWMGIIIALFVGKVLSVIAEWVDGLRQVGDKIVEKVRTGIEEAWDIVEYLGKLLGAIAQSILDGDFMNNLKDVGKKIVELIKAGVEAAWSGFLSDLQEKLNAVRDMLPFSEPRDPRSPLRGLGKAGEALAKNMAAGISMAPVRAALLDELAGTRALLQGASLGGLNIGPITQEFPNVRDGRDAFDINSALSDLVQQASMMGRTGG